MMTGSVFGEHEAALTRRINFYGKTLEEIQRQGVVAGDLSAILGQLQALEQAGLLGHPVLKSGKVGVSYGSSAGSHEAIGDFGRMLNEHTTAGINATTYIKMMSHTAPVNIGVFFGLTGRVITTSSACTSVSFPSSRFLNSPVIQ